jgi:hypothetical protein
MNDARDPDYRYDYDNIMMSCTLHAYPAKEAH